MSNVFGEYASCYDKLYSDKDYAGEVRFIRSLLPENTQSILELGCGTGRHAALLAASGYKVSGVDLSSEMLAVAEERRASLPEDEAERLRFIQGDIRGVRLSETFDVVLSLFHVICYQTTDADLAAAFETARIHLKSGGLFIFDIWYGPAVERDPPAQRIKRFEDDQLEITRVAEPFVDRRKHLVDVNYQIIVREKILETTREIFETHRIRYFFENEINTAVKQGKMLVRDHKEWLTGKIPDILSWNTYFIAAST